MGLIDNIKIIAYSRRRTASSIAIGHKELSEMLQVFEVLAVSPFGDNRSSSLMPILSPASMVDVVPKRSGLEGIGNQTEG